MRSGGTGRLACLVSNNLRNTPVEDLRRRIVAMLIEVIKQGACTRKLKQQIVVGLRKQADAAIAPVPFEIMRAAAQLFAHAKRRQVLDHGSFAALEPYLDDPAGDGFSNQFGEGDFSLGW